jgi:hypothetical protein
LSEVQEERIEIDNNRDFEQSSDIAEPGEIIREQVVEVAEKPNTQTFPMSSKEEENQVKTDDEDIHEQLKAQSIQLNSLAEMVKSLQSQVKHLQETTRLLKHKKTSSVRKTITKTKNKTKRRGNARSRKK